MEDNGRTGRGEMKEGRQVGGEHGVREGRDGGRKITAGQGGEGGVKRK